LFVFISQCSGYHTIKRGSVGSLCARVVLWLGQEAIIRHLSVSKLLPATGDYITYDGSMTQPGCQETVTWIIMNKPLYMSIHHVRRPTTIAFSSCLWPVLNRFLSPVPVKNNVSGHQSANPTRNKYASTRNANARVANPA